MSLLTIAIPTWNRCKYLELNLYQLLKEVSSLEDPSDVRILISDNCSSDGTARMVQEFLEKTSSIDYIRNFENIGWGKNFLQCFERSESSYVLILGDDDYIVDGALAELTDLLKKQDFGVVCLKPYGFDFDYKVEFPGGGGELEEFTDPVKFISETSSLLTLISACVLNKKMILNKTKFETTSKNLPIFSLVLSAVFSADRNAFFGKYMLGCKRNNSSSYVFSDVFVNEMWEIFDIFKNRFALQSDFISLERKFLLSYYPLYLLQLRLTPGYIPDSDLTNFDTRFKSKTIYRIWLRPILSLPKYVAILHGGIVTCIGRVLGGDLYRGLTFLKCRILSFLHK